MARISGMAAEYPIRPESVRRCMAASDTAGPDIPMESAETITFTPPFENEDVISGQEICQAKSDIIVQKRDFINFGDSAFNPLSDAGFCPRRVEDVAGQRLQRGAVTLGQCG
jgi:hypothetical protein